MFNTQLFQEKYKIKEITINKKPVKNKKFITAFKLIYGVNQKRLQPLIHMLGIHSQIEVLKLTEVHFQVMKFFFEHSDSQYILPDLYREKYTAIKNLIKMKCYKGIRHQKQLPVRGQRTHSNSKTCKRPYFYITEYTTLHKKTKTKQPHPKKPLKAKKSVQKKIKNKK
jgi:small subunit ribosomal protein S13